MIDKAQIVDSTEIVGADGVHLGTVDHIDGDFIKMTKGDSPQFEGCGGKHHWIPIGLVASTEDGRVRLSANAAVAFDLFEEAE